MKKATFFIIAVFMLMTLASCEDPKNPGYNPMTKWESDNLELYVLENSTGLLVVDYKDEKFAYDVKFFAGSAMEVYDRRRIVSTKEETIDSTADELTDRDSLFEVGSWVLGSFKKTSCKASSDNDNIFVQAGIISEDIRFKRTAVDLTLDDIPQIDLDEDYGYCPNFYPGSKWVSDDNKICITMIRRPRFGYMTLGVVEFSDEHREDVYIYFFECNSAAYLGELKVSLEHYADYYDIREAQDEWKCEYFENGFKATVIRSDYYEVGSVINFTRLEDDVVTE